MVAQNGEKPPPHSLGYPQGCSVIGGCQEGVMHQILGVLMAARKTEREPKEWCMMMLHPFEQPFPGYRPTWIQNAPPFLATSL